MTKEGSAISGWKEMAAAFESKRLPVPPVPESLRDAIEAHEEWCWATKPMVGMDMYLMHMNLPSNQIFAGPVADYVAASHAGHGVNSWAINYHLVYRDLAVFLQVSWGGLYTDNEAAAASLAEIFAQCQRLMEIVEQRPRSSARLVCLESRFRWVRRRPMTACGWVRQPDPDAASRFLEEHRVESGSALDVAERLIHSA